MGDVNRVVDMAITVRDIMQGHLVTVVPEMTVRELAQLFTERRISGAPVLDRRGKPIGVVSATDVMRLVAHEAEIPSGQVDWTVALLAEECNEADPDGAVPATFTASSPEALAESGLDQYCVGDIMTPVAFTVHPSDSLREVVAFLLRGRVHRALVMENEQLLGIVTPFDVLQAMDAPLTLGTAPRELAPMA